jgi:hypothetical protein
MNIPKCDFCSSHDIVWRYPCADFGVTLFLIRKDGEILEIPWLSGGHWVACEICSQHIEAEEWDRLAQRGLDTFPGADVLGPILKDGQIKKAIKEMHTNFIKLHGPRQPL